MTRFATDALARLTVRQRVTVIARTVEMMFTSIAMQKRRRGLPLTCPFASCAWEAPRPRVTKTTKAALRDHLIASHCTALEMMEG